VRVLVTGGTGFVGARLCERLLAGGHEVRNLDVRPAPVSAAAPTLVGDIRDYETCRTALRATDAVLHLAALYRDDVRPRELYYQVNVDGTRNIARAAAENGVPAIVFTSSFSVYGLDDAGKSEEGALSPVNDYGRSKMAAEEILLEWQRLDQSRSLQMIRPSVIFGEGNRGNVWTLLNEIANGRFALLGRGANHKSVAYVGNVVEFLVMLLERPPTRAGLYNYTDKPDMTVSELVDLAAHSLGRKVRRIPLPGGAAMMLGYLGDALGGIAGRTLTLNSERIRKFLANTSLPIDRVTGAGFVAPFDVRTALVRTIEHDFGAGRNAHGAPRPR
jgi:GlcNAc-P-P-Und epimerase